MKERVPNVNADLLLQRTPEDQLSLTAVVEAVREKATQAGKKYHVLEFVDPEGQIKRVSVWDKKVAVGLQHGDVIDLTLTKNDKGFWNLSALSKVESTPTSSASSEPTPPPLKDSPVTAKTADKTAPEPKTDSLITFEQRARFSVNALASATSIVVAYRDVLGVTTRDELMSNIVHFYDALMHIHVYGTRS